MLEGPQACKDTKSKLSCRKHSSFRPSFAKLIRQHISLFAICFVSISHDILYRFAFISLFLHFRFVPEFIVLDSYDTVTVDMIGIANSNKRANLGNAWD